MIRIVELRGAPVIDAPGNSAPNTSVRVVPGRVVATTVEVSCQTVS